MIAFFLDDCLASVLSIFTYMNVTYLFPHLEFHIFEKTAITGTSFLN